MRISSFNDRFTFWSFRRDIWTIDSWISKGKTDPPSNSKQRRASESRNSCASWSKLKQNIKRCNRNNPENQFKILEYWSNLQTDRDYFVHSSLFHEKSKVKMDQSYLIRFAYIYIIFSYNLFSTWLPKVSMFQATENFYL